MGLVGIEEALTEGGAGIGRLFARLERGRPALDAPCAASRRCLRHRSVRVTIRAVRQLMSRRGAGTPAWSICSTHFHLLMIEGRASVVRERQQTK
jgi:hypothetical protein